MNVIEQLNKERESLLEKVDTIEKTIKVLGGGWSSSGGKSNQRKRRTGEEIAKLVKQVTGLTGEMAAKKVGVSVQTIYQWRTKAKSKAKKRPTAKSKAEAKPAT